MLLAGDCGLLAGDVGGTKTALAIYAPEGGVRSPLAEATFSNASYPSLESIVREFLRGADLPVDRAVFGVAGPVVDGQVIGTNLPWQLDEASLRKSLDLSSARLLNDLEAIAYAVPILGEDDLCTLSEGQRDPKGALGVIAPGTGLGEAFLTWEGSGYRAHPSEGGHADFAPNTPLQIELLRYLQERHGHVSYERVCSGRGLPNIYAFLRDSGHAQEPAWLAEQLASTSDPTPIIVDAGLDEKRPCELCKTVLDIFISILGAEAGNLALKLMATGGIYLAGGMLPHILPALKGELFGRAFQNKGRLSYVVAQVPVYVILNPNAGRLGAAQYGRSEFGSLSEASEF